MLSVTDTIFENITRKTTVTFNGSIFHLNVSVPYTLSNLTFNSCFHSLPNGGIIYTAYPPSLSNCLFKNCSSNEASSSLVYTSITSNPSDQFVMKYLTFSQCQTSSNTDVGIYVRINSSSSISSILLQENLVGTDYCTEKDKFWVTETNGNGNNVPLSEYLNVSSCAVGAASSDDQITSSQSDYHHHLLLPTQKSKSFILFLHLLPHLPLLNSPISHSMAHLPLSTFISSSLLHSQSPLVSLFSISHRHQLLSYNLSASPLLLLLLLLLLSLLIHHHFCSSVVMLPS